MIARTSHKNWRLESSPPKVELQRAVDHNLCADDALGDDREHLFAGGRLHQRFRLPFVEQCHFLLQCVVVVSKGAEQAVVGSQCSAQSERSREHLAVQSAQTNTQNRKHDAACKCGWSVGEVVMTLSVDGRCDKAVCSARPELRGFPIRVSSDFAFETTRCRSTGVPIQPLSPDVPQELLQPAQHTVCRGCVSPTTPSS